MSKKKHTCGWCGRAGWGSEDERPEGWVKITIEVPDRPLDIVELCDMSCAQAWLEDRGVIISGTIVDA